MKNKFNRCCCVPQGCVIAEDEFDIAADHDPGEAFPLNEPPTSGWKVLSGNLLKDVNGTIQQGSAVLNKAHPSSGPLNWLSSGHLEATIILSTGSSPQSIALLIEPDKTDASDTGYEFVVQSNEPSDPSTWIVKAGLDFSEIFQHDINRLPSFKICIDYYSGKHEDGPHTTSFKASIQDSSGNVLWSKTWTSSGIPRNHGLVGFSVLNENTVNAAVYRFYYGKSSREDSECPDCLTKPLKTSVSSIRGGFAFWQSLLRCDATGHGVLDPIKITGAGSELASTMNRFAACASPFDSYQGEIGWNFSVHGALSLELPDASLQQFLVPYVSDQKVPPGPPYDGTVFDVYGHAYGPEDGSMALDPLLQQMRWRPNPSVLIPRANLLGTFTISLNFTYGGNGQTPNFANIVNLVRSSPNFVKSRGLTVFLKPRETYTYVETGGTIFFPFPNAPQDWIIRTPTPTREAWRIFYS